MIQSALVCILLLILLIQFGYCLHASQELQSTVNRLNNRLKKEENSKRMRLKILQRAFHDNMKDKQKLIVNLQVQLCFSISDLHDLLYNALPIHYVSILVLALSCCCKVV